MQKLKISLLLLVTLIGQSKAQDFLDPYTSFFSLQPAYVITQEGDSIAGFLRGATEASGFIKKLTMEDLDGNRYKFKADQIQRFAIQPGAFAKAESAANRTQSVRKALRADFNELLDRDWLIYDSQQIPRRKNKTGLLQLLNPGFDQHVKVYYHPNGSKSMPIAIKGIRVMGGEERTFLVAKGDNNPVIVRKSGFKNTFAQLFNDDADFVKGYARKAKFKHFATLIGQYNDLMDQKNLSTGLDEQ